MEKSTRHPEMEKSTRHSKITGDFGESLILYWLSRSGFEATLVDHTGIDIVAFRQKTGERFGISVKSRSKKTEKAQKSLLVEDSNCAKKIDDACKFFGCDVQAMAFVFDRPTNNDEGDIDVYLLTSESLSIHCRGFKENTRFTFSTSERNLEKYRDDPKIWKIHFDYKMTDWPKTVSARTKGRSPKMFLR